MSVPIKDRVRDLSIGDLQAHYQQHHRSGYCVEYSFKSNATFAILQIFQLLFTGCQSDYV